MIRWPTLALAVLAAALPALHGAGARQKDSPAQPEQTAIRAARLLDVKAGTYLKNPVVLVSAGRIVAVGANLPIPPGARVIELGGATLLPGLID